MNIPKDVLLSIAASALGYDDAAAPGASVAIATEWHILYTAGIVPTPVPKGYQSLVRGQPGAGAGTARRSGGASPFAGYRTSVQVAAALGIKPRTVRKHAQRLNVGTLVGHQRMYNTDDLEAIRAVTAGGRPETRSDTDWR